MADDQQQDDNYNNNNQYQQEEEDDICKVYDKEDFFTVAVQIFLALLALMSLYIKRLRETPRRTFRTWFLDISKQAAGACYAHVLNMMIANVISKNIRGDTVLDDQCAWYGLSYLIDTTLGLVLAVIGLRILDDLANDRDWAHLKHSGVYDGPDGNKHWFSQVVAWLFILTVVKLIIYLFMWVFSEPLAWIGKLIFAPFQGHKKFELLFVMIFFPGFLNVIYFWIADGYLKATADQSGAHEDDGDDDKKESLVKDIAEAELTFQNTPPWSALAFGRKAAQEPPPPAQSEHTTAASI